MIPAHGIDARKSDREQNSGQSEIPFPGFQVGINDQQENQKNKKEGVRKTDAMNCRKMTIGFWFHDMHPQIGPESVLGVSDNINPW